MKSALQLAFWLSVLAPLSFAATVPGALVDAKCYASVDGNTNPTNTLQYVNRDGAGEVRYCAPKPKTKSFTLIQVDGESLKLDAAGNAKAAELVRSLGKKHLYRVTVTGDVNGKEIRVDAIAASAAR